MAMTSMTSMTPVTSMAPMTMTVLMQHHAHAVGGEGSEEGGEGEGRGGEGEGRKWAVMLCIHEITMGTGLNG